MPLLFLRPPLSPLWQLSKSRVTKEVLPSSMAGQQGNWKPKLELLKLSVWSGGSWLQRSSAKPVQSTREKSSPSKSETLHPGTVPSQIFGLCFAIPPTKSRYVLSKCFTKIKHNPRASCAFTAAVPKKGTALEGCAPGCNSWEDDWACLCFSQMGRTHGSDHFVRQGSPSHRSVRKGQQRVKVFRPLQPHQSYSPFLFSFISGHFHQTIHSHPFP